MSISVGFLVGHLKEVHLVWPLLIQLWSILNKTRKASSPLRSLLVPNLVAPHLQDVFYLKHKNW